MAKEATNPGLLQGAGEVFLGVARGLWDEGAEAVSQMREEIVDRGWFGRHPVPGAGEQDRGSVHGPAVEKDAGDAMGRTVDAEPTFLSSEDRHGFAEAYARHLEIGPIGAQEIQTLWDWAERDGLTSDGPEAAEAGRDHDAENAAYEMKRDELER